MAASSPISLTPSAFRYQNLKISGSAYTLGSAELTERVRLLNGNPTSPQAREFQQQELDAMRDGRAFPGSSLNREALVPQRMAPWRDRPGSAPPGRHPPTHALPAEGVQGERVVYVPSDVAVQRVVGRLSLIHI